VLACDFAIKFNTLRHLLYPVYRLVWKIWPHRSTVFTDRSAEKPIKNCDVNELVCMDICFQCGCIQFLCSVYRQSSYLVQWLHLRKTWLQAWGLIPVFCVLF